MLVIIQRVASNLSPSTGAGGGLQVLSSHAIEKASMVSRAGFFICGRRFRRVGTPCPRGTHGSEAVGSEASLETRAAASGFALGQRAIFRGQRRKHAHVTAWALRV